MNIHIHIYTYKITYIYIHQYKNTCEIQPVNLRESTEIIGIGGWLVQLTIFGAFSIALSRILAFRAGFLGAAQGSLETAFGSDAEDGRQSAGT